MTIVDAHTLLLSRDDRSIFPELVNDPHWSAFATALAILGDDDNELAHCRSNEDLDSRIRFGLARLNSEEVSLDALYQTTDRVISLVAADVEEQEEKYAYLFKHVSWN